MIVQLWWWNTTPTMAFIAHQSPVSTDQQQLIHSRRHLLSSGLHWFPREIDCPKRVAPQPHTIVLWHLIHEFRLIVCTSYTDSSCCTLLYSFILWCCFIRLHKLLLCLFLVYTLSAIHYYLEYTPHHSKHTESWRSTPQGSTHINSYTLGNRCFSPSSWIHSLTHASPNISRMNSPVSITQRGS